MSTSLPAELTLLFFFLSFYLFVSPFPLILRRIFIKPSLLLWLVLVYLSFIYIVMCFPKAVVSPTKASNALRNQFENTEKHDSLYWSTGSCFRKLWRKKLYMFGKNLITNLQDSIGCPTDQSQCQTQLYTEGKLWLFYSFIRCVLTTHNIIFTI